jgi:hypothetical protein
MRVDLPSLDVRQIDRICAPHLTDIISTVAVHIGGYRVLTETSDRYGA